jgi:hypothetical protein
LIETLGGDQFLSSGPGDCELLVDPEVFGRGGVGVDSEYVLSAGPEGCELSVDPGVFEGGGVGVEPEDSGKGGVEVEPEDFGKGGVEVESEYDLGHLSLLTVQTVRW